MWNIVVAGEDELLGHRDSRILVQSVHHWQQGK